MEIGITLVLLLAVPLILKVSEKTITDLLQHIPENSMVNCHYFRDDALSQTQLKVINAPNLAVDLVVKNLDLALNWQTINDIN